MSSPRIRISLDLTLSRYKRKRIPIYRADLPGGVLWGFPWEGSFILCSTIAAARDLIDTLVEPDEVPRCSKSYCMTMIQDAKIAIEGFFEVAEE